MGFLTDMHYVRADYLKVTKLLSPIGGAWWLVSRVLSGVLLLLAFFGTYGLTPAFAEPHSDQEYQVKAAYIFNFANYVEWPREAFQGDSSSLVICVLGKEPFANILNSISGKNVQGKKIVVRQAMQIEDVKECHILYIIASDKRNLGYVLKTLKGRHVLTVGDQDRFCQTGGMINLVTMKNKIGFEINSSAAKRAGINISSQLLKLASDVIE
jgi:hypothetical protein